LHTSAELQSSVVTLSEDAKKELVFDPDQLSYQMDQNRVAGGGIVKGTSFVSKTAGEIALKSDDWEAARQCRRGKCRILGYELSPFDHSAQLSGQPSTSSAEANAKKRLKIYRIVRNSEGVESVGVETLCILCRLP
jgi:hypothetical protein